jgi:ferric-dicitrate binding protein FerR (iron transport regulator)
VAKNASMPFKVKIANKAEIEVLGTHFNVNAYADEPSINTTLMEGSVKVNALFRQDSRLIKPGDQAQLKEDGKINIVKQANAEQWIAWKNGIFSFDSADLEMSLRQLARWYDIEIEFEGSTAQKKFSGEMQRNLSISQVIKLLETNNVYCRLEGRKLIVAK